MKSQILLDGESYLLTDRRGERGDAAFTRKLAHTDGRVAESRFDGLVRVRAAERNVQMRGLG